MPGIGNAIGIPFKKGGGISWSSYWASRFPSALTATTVSATQINLGWTNNGTTDYIGHKVYISTDNVTFTLFATIPTIGTTYSAIGLTSNTTYYFYVVAYNGASASTSSNINYAKTSFNSALVAGWKLDGTNYFTDTLSDYAFHIYHTESAQYFNGKTYVAYSGNSFNPYITYFDHTTLRWATPVKIGDNPLPDEDIGHGEPSMLIDADGYIHVLWGAHSYMAFPDAFQYSISTNPEDISAWTAQASPENGTYPQFIQLSNGTIYIFFRKTPDAGWGYITSTDSGANWSVFTKLLTNYPGFGYAKFVKGVGDIIHCVTSKCEDNSLARFNVYYLYFEGGVWKNILGATLTLPLDIPATNILVHNSGTDYIPAHTVGFDANNKPYIFFNQGFDVVGTYTYKVAAHNGTAWIVSDVGVTTDHAYDYASAIDVIGINSIDLYLITGGNAGAIGGNIEKWYSGDGGTTFVKKETIISGQLNQVAIVKDYHHNAKVVFCEYKNSIITWTGKGYLWGDNEFAKSQLAAGPVVEIKGVHTGTVVGTLTRPVGKYGSCLLFPNDGNNKVTIEDHNDFSFTDGDDLPFSITFFLNMVGVAGTQNVITKRTDQLQSEYWIDLTGNTIRFLLNSAFDAANTIYATAPFTTTGSWVFFCVSYDGGGVEAGIKIYINCVESQTFQGEVGTYVKMSNGTSKVYIGAKSTTANPLNGNIDEIKFWNKVLSIPEQTLVMNNDVNW